jgi:hypothetical protein
MQTFWLLAILIGYPVIRLITCEPIINWHQLRNLRFLAWLALHGLTVVLLRYFCNFFNLSWMILRFYSRFRLQERGAQKGGAPALRNSLH